jgi:hypothetical protein
MGLIAFFDGVTSTSPSAPDSAKSSSLYDIAVLICRPWFVTVTVEDVEAADGA